MAKSKSILNVESKNITKISRPLPTTRPHPFQPTQRSTTRLTPWPRTTPQPQRHIQLQRPGPRPTPQPRPATAPHPTPQPAPNFTAMAERPTQRPRPACYRRPQEQQQPRQRANLPAGLGGSRLADETAGKPAAHQRSRRRTPPARECTPSGGQKLKRNETCARKDRVAAEAKRRWKGH